MREERHISRFPCLEEKYNLVLLNDQLHLWKIYLFTGSSATKAFPEHLDMSFQAKGKNPFISVHMKARITVNEMTIKLLIG